MNNLVKGLMVERANFPVREENLITNSNLATEFKAVIREDTNTVIGVATNKYHSVPNQQIQEFFDTQIAEFFPPNVVETIKVDLYLPHGGGKYIKKYHITDPAYKVEIREDDFVSPTISTYNSYDSSLAMGFDIGAFRLACSNGMMIGKQFIAKKMRHYITCSPEVFQKDLESTMKKYMDITEIWKGWVNEVWDVADVEEYLSNESISEKKAKEIVEQFKRQGENNKWMFYNAITYVITHQTVARKEENTILSQMNLAGIVENLYRM